MKDTKGGGPAFPMIHTQWSDERVGMSLRDYFAGQALAGFLSNGDLVAFPFSSAAAGQVSAFCYEMADAILKERAK